MNIDCGTIMSGESVVQTGRRIFDEIIAGASSKKTKSESLDPGDEEFPLGCRDGRSEYLKKSPETPQRTIQD
jgi:hypothetical protein